MCKKQTIDSIKLIDQSVGNLIKIRRLELGFNQKDIAKVIGVSAQQLQKYEKGINRITGGKLECLARFLRVPINYFFDFSNSNQ